MGVAGEGAAIVPGDGEGLHNFFNTTSDWRIPRPHAAPAPAPALAAGRDDVDDRAQAQAEHRADGRAPDHVGGVVGPQVDPAGRHRGGETDVGGRAGLGVAQDEGRAEGGEGVAAREAAARRGAHADVEMVLGPLPLDRRLHDPAHEQGGEPGRRQRHDGAPPVGAASPCLEPGQQDPDEPVVGQVGHDGRGAVDLRAAPEGFEGGVDRLVDGAHCAARHAAKAGQEVLKWQWLHNGADVGAEVLGVAGPLNGRPHGNGPPALAADGLLRRHRRNGDGLAQVEQPDLGRRPSEQALAQAARRSGPRPCCRARSAPTAPARSCSRRRSGRRRRVTSRRSMMPRRRMPSTMVSTPSSMPTARASLGSSRQEVVVDQRARRRPGTRRPRPGRARAPRTPRRPGARPSSERARPAPPRASACPGGVVPEEPLQRGVDQGALDGVGGGRLGPMLDLREAEGERAVGEGDDLRRAQGAWEVERHAGQDTAGQRRAGTSSSSR